MKFFQKIILSVAGCAMVTQSLILPLAANAQGANTVATRAITRAQRIATASARVAAAQLTLDQAIFAFAAYPPTIITPAEYALRYNKIAEAGQELAVATTELQDANTTIQEDILETLEKVLFQTLKKKMLDMVVDQIIGYIQGEGEPKFITDWQGFFGDIAQGAIGDLAQALGAGFLCSPFSLPIRLQIAGGLAPVDRFKTKFTCTLDQIVGNIEAFYDDFRNGGWKAFDVAWEPQNNYYGAIFLAWDAEHNLIADRLVSAANEAIVNEGWLGVRKCYDKSGKEVDVPSGYGSMTGVDCTIITPGKALGDLTAKAIGADIDFIVNSEDLSDYIASITNALINRVIKEGVGLLGVSTPSAPQRVRASDPLDNVIYGSGNIPGSVQGTIGQYSASLSEQTGQAATGVTEDKTSTKYIVLQQLEATRDERLAARNFYNNRLELEESYQNKLLSLAVCQDDKNDPDFAATQAKIKTETDILKKLNDDIISNHAVLTQLGDAISLVQSMTESQVTSQLSTLTEVLRLLNDFPVAKAAHDTAKSEFEKAQNIVPQLIAEAEEKLRQCLAK